MPDVFDERTNQRESLHSERGLAEPRLVFPLPGLNAEWLKTGKAWVTTHPGTRRFRSRQRFEKQTLEQGAALSTTEDATLSILK